MSEKTEPMDGEWIGDLLVRSEKLGFEREEMIDCAKCGKVNPPTRLNCFYCSSGLKILEDQRHTAKLDLRKPESWEKGFNIIYQNFTDALDLPAIAQFLSVNEEFLNRVCGFELPIPLSRLGSEREAEFAIKRLSDHGLHCSIMSDEKLQADKPPIRIRGIEFGDKSLMLTVFNTGKKIEVVREDLLLIVTGIIFESRSELIQLRKKKASKLVNESQTTSDEVVLDIYSSDDSIGFRVPARGFDFSCLGNEKGLLVADNMQKLAERLRDFSPRVRVDNDYIPIREILEYVWDVERRRDSNGLQRTGIRGTEIINLAVSSNLQQFTKYSRLRRHLL